MALGQAGPSSQWAVGLMSGTSLDGIDAALLRTNGEQVMARGGGLFLPFSEEMRARLQAALGCMPDDPSVVETEHAFTALNQEAVMQLLAQAGLSPRDIAVIGFHGQTLWHRSPRLHGRGETCQIGDGRRLNVLTGIPVVHQFRRADMAAGGEGAPLVPIYHQALVRGLPKPVMCVNVGGVANVTWIGGEHPKDLLAFDVGPGNVMIDQWVQQHDGGHYDVDGALAARGRIHGGVLKALVAQGLFDQPPPKSFDRLNFSLESVRSLSLEDGAATLTMLTVQGIVSAVRFVDVMPQTWIVMGGGAKNPTLMAWLKKELAPIRVMTADEMGLRSDMMEAEAFAFLAMRTLKGLPLTFPSTTGVPAPTCGGVLWSCESSQDTELDSVVIRYCPTRLGT